MSISLRLKKIAELVTPGHTAADIGTDHGYVPVFLLKEKISPKVIAIDTSRGSLEKAYQNAKKKGITIIPNSFTDSIECGTDSINLEKNYDDKEASDEQGAIEIRCSDGLTSLKTNEVDTIIISGMGGILMCRILSESSDVARSVRELILSPHRDADLVRDLVRESGFTIVIDEEFIDKKKKYILLKAVKD